MQSCAYLETVPYQTTESQIQPWQIHVDNTLWHLQFLTPCGIHSKTSDRQPSMQANLYFYLSQRSWGKVIFSEACVKNSVQRGGVHGRGGIHGRGHA